MRSLVTCEIPFWRQFFVCGIFLEQEAKFKAAKNMSRIYIGRLSHNAREKDVDRFFRGFGRIRDINLKNGFGFVEFDDPRDADDAVYELNGRELLGERVIVEHSRGTSSGYGRRYGSGGGGDRGGDRYYDRGRGGGGGGGGGRGGYGPPTRTDYRILVENISSRVSWQDLKDFMRSAGEITFADAHKQRVGDGVVEYASYEDMKSALKKLDGAELNGRKLKLTEDSRSKKRSRSRSRSHGRSRSRSRSKERRYRSRSKSRSRDRYRSRSGSRSRSRSRDNDRSRSRSKSRSRSRSKSANGEDRAGSRSKSREPIENNGEEHPAVDEDQMKQDSPQLSRESSRARDTSASPRKDDEMKSASVSPARNDVDE